ncbi:MAG: SusC/RagA family TonB-linked outer membrane protein [Bacteroidales bacterium]
MKKTNSFIWPSGPCEIFHRLQILMKMIVLFLLVGLIFQPAYSAGGDDDQQQIRITGTVTDGETGNPMPGVNIQVKGTTVGAITDADGRYVINVTDRNAILVFSFIGYDTKEVPLAGRIIADVVLSPTVTDLDEVVVVGYSTQKKANVIGSVTSLPGAQIQSIPSPSVAQALSGRLPGSIIIQLNNEPGQNTTRILVRGRTTLGGSRAAYASQTEPLVIIDGVPGRSMTEIDPNDIETLSVLKDASAAIYGAQAANGVILITTKKGSEGAPRLNYQFYQGFMTPTIIPEVCDAAEYATMLSEYQVATGKTRTYTDADIELFRSGADPWEHPNTDWYRELIKNWTGTTRHNISIDGGFRGMTYFISAGYKADDAFYKASSTKYTQYNVRAKLDLPITDWLKVGTELAGFQVNRLYPYKSAGSIVGQSTRLVPTTWAYWPNGLPGPDIEYGDNPVVTSTFAGGKDDQKTYRVLTTFSGIITVPFVKGLTLNGNYSYDLTNFYRKRFFKPWVLYYPNWAEATRDPVTGFVTDMPVIPTLRGLSYPQNHEDYSRTINETILLNANYNRKFGEHTVTLYAGFEQYTNDYNNLYGYRTYYISDLIQTMNAGADQDKNTTGGRSIYARKSYIGRASYDFRGKYLAEIVFRADGSLKYPPEGRWGYFPGFLLGWRASEESFWKDNIAFINYFKLKASYGSMGMDPGSAFQYMNTFGLSSGMSFGTSAAIETAVGPPTVANPEITWEKQTTKNIGFESKLFRDLFHLNFEYFYNIRKDILAARDASVPDFTGLSLPQENIARVDNQGFEIEAGVHKNITSDLRIDFGGNFSYNHNEVVFMDEPARAVPWQQYTGHPYNAWLMYRAIGIFEDDTYTVNGVANYPRWANAKPGDVIFEDVSGDGKIDGNDMVLIDEVDVPETFYGINLDATWKNFKLSVLVQGQGKFLKFNHYDERRGEAGNYYKWTYDNRWTENNRKTDIARAFNRNDFYWAHAVNMSTYWLDNTAYCRLRDVVLTYNIPSTIFRGIGISRASVYFSGHNLAFLYTATRKFDPEVTSQEVYPMMKTFAFGANITF